MRFYYKAAPCHTRDSQAGNKQTWTKNKKPHDLIFSDM